MPKSGKDSFWSTETIAKARGHISLAKGVATDDMRKPNERVHSHLTGTSALDEEDRGPKKNQEITDENVTAAEQGSGERGNAAIQVLKKLYQQNAAWSIQNGANTHGEPRTEEPMWANLLLMETTKIWSANRDK